MDSNENTAEKLYDSFTSISDIQRLIDEGETENQYLECKSPSAPFMDRGLKQELAKEISGFANAGGGVILWGVSTTNHVHTKLDTLTQIEELGSVKSFKKQIDLAVLTVVEPQIISCRSKILSKNSTDTRGIIVTYIPPTPGDPIRNSGDQEFSIRVGPNCSAMPYETIKRMFSGSAGCDLSVFFANELVKLKADGSWEIPVVLVNNSSSVAKDVDVSVMITNDLACDSISAIGFNDQSSINPGKKVFMGEVNRPIFRGKNLLAGTLIVKMKKQKLSKRKLILKINIFAANMRARTYTMVVRLASKKGFSVRKTQMDYLY